MTVERVSVGLDKIVEMHIYIDGEMQHACMHVNHMENVRIRVRGTRIYKFLSLPYRCFIQVFAPEHVCVHFMREYSFSWACVVDACVCASDRVCLR